MKNIVFVLLVFVILFLGIAYYFPQEGVWAKTEGEITEITVHRGKRLKESALIAFTLENGTEQMGTAELIRIPFIGSTKSVGDKIAINYNIDNPVMIETVLRHFLSRYGMYILLFFGIIYSIKPFLKKKEYNK